MTTRTKLEFGVPRVFAPLLPHRRYKGASGGRASAKSHFFAGQGLKDMVADADLRFVCIREVQKSLKYSAKSLVEHKIKQFGVGHLFEVLSTEIRSRGGNGVMIFQGMQDHTSESIKSLEGFDRAWVEEAQSLSEKSLRLLRPTIRGEGSEIWFSWNPNQPDDPVDAFFAANADHPDFAHVHGTYKDNPYCPDVMKAEAAMDLAADPEMYEHVWGGGYFYGGQGRVYNNFKNKPAPNGNLDEGIEDIGGELLVGMDFNVNPMSAVMAIRAGDECHVIGELELNSSSTEEMAAELRTRYPDRTIIVCPDPSGRARKTSAPVGQTDFTILKRAGFKVRSPSKAPMVVDRINNVNAMLYDAKQDRRKLIVHPTARSLVKSLVHMTYKEGTSQPDKASGLDHMADALGYLLWQEFNVLQAREAVADNFRWA